MREDLKKLSNNVQKTLNITAIGEILIDFTDCGRSQYGTRLFSQNPGGAPGNVAAAAARLGLKSAFIGKVGDDMHGEFLRASLAGAGVDTSGLVKDGSYFTTLAFVQLGEDGERSFSFARKHGADTQLRFDEIPDRLLSETQVLHFGTIAMTDEPEQTAQLKCIERAKSCGALLSFDPNYRDTLWGSAGQFVRCTRELLSFADLVKISEEEMELVTGETDPGRAIEYLLGRGARIAAVTLGKRGAIAGSRTAGLVYREGRKCEPIDATGAGDAFWGGFLSAMLTSGTEPERAGEHELGVWLDFANGVGAYCTAHFGGISGMPTQEQLGEFFENSEQK